MNTELLPEWTDCQSAFASGTTTPLTEFIRAYEPIQSTRPNDKAADEWRQALASVLDLTASRMRDACVGTVKAMAAEVEHGDVLLSARKVIAALESLTLDQVAADSTQKDNEHHG